MGTDFIDCSIITPSLNSLDFLKQCHASIIDQEGTIFEHIVIDGGSKEETVEWLSQNKEIVSISEKDNGMYNAINKGLQLARGRIVSYLNCDEQYLPGTLRFVKAFFEKHLDVDILFGDALLVRPDGSLIAYRKGYQPRWPYIMSSHLYVLSCTMFVRKRVIEDGFRFDEHFRVIGDQDFVIRMLQAGYRAAHVRRYMASFTMTGTNMSLSPIARLEIQRAAVAAPAWIRFLWWPLNIMRLTEKFISGAYWQKMPFEYSIYAFDGEPHRKSFKNWKASFRWQLG